MLARYSKYGIDFRVQPQSVQPQSVQPQSVQPQSVSRFRRASAM